VIDVNELRNGVTFELDGRLYKVLEYSHHKPGRGKATIRVRIRDLVSGSIVDKSFNSSDRVQDIRLEYRVAQFLYREGEIFHFMDVETYEQPELRGDVLGDAANYITEGQQVKLTFYEGKPLDIELPTSVELRVTEAEMAVKGDTATGANKTVTTETGLKVQVPLFVQSGDVIKVDTRNGAYITRA
jgi:elongation factor P